MRHTLLPVASRSQEKVGTGFLASDNSATTTKKAFLSSLIPHNLVNSSISRTSFSHVLFGEEVSRPGKEEQRSEERKKMSDDAYESRAVADDSILVAVGE